MYAWCWYGAGCGTVAKSAAMVLVDGRLAGDWRVDKRERRRGQGVVTRDARTTATSTGGEAISVPRMMVLRGEGVGRSRESGSSWTRPSDNRCLLQRYQDDCPSARCGSSDRRRRMAIGRLTDVQTAGDKVARWVWCSRRRGHNLSAQGGATHMAGLARRGLYSRGRACRRSRGQRAGSLPLVR